mmetsp:Transcript_26982/g.77472  ORF Transcript_26982/g.77472 Transcript_26982/m.77472 type:complete len:254 (-) Transcript_26982:874-1635(-)
MHVCRDLQSQNRPIQSVSQSVPNAARTYTKPEKKLHCKAPRELMPCICSVCTGKNIILLPCLYGHSYLRENGRPQGRQPLAVGGRHPSPTATRAIDALPLPGMGIPPPLNVHMRLLLLLPRTMLLPHITPQSPSLALAPANHPPPPQQRQHAIHQEQDEQQERQSQLPPPSLQLAVPAPHGRGSGACAWVGCCCMVGGRVGERGRRCRAAVWRTLDKRQRLLWIAADSRAVGAGRPQWQYGGRCVIVGVVLDA